MIPAISRLKVTGPGLGRSSGFACAGDGLPALPNSIDNPSTIAPLKKDLVFAGIIIAYLDSDRAFSRAAEAPRDAKGAPSAGMLAKFQSSFNVGNLKMFLAESRQGREDPFLLLAAARRLNYQLCHEWRSLRIWQTRRQKT